MTDAESKRMIESLTSEQFDPETLPHPKTIDEMFKSHFWRSLLFYATPAHETYRAMFRLACMCCPTAFPTWPFVSRVSQADMEWDAGVFGRKVVGTEVMPR